MKNIMLFMLSLVGLTLVWLILLASTVSLSDTRSYEVSRSVQKLDSEKEAAVERRKTNSSNIQAQKEIEENPQKIKEDQQKTRLEKNRAFCENKKFQHSSKFELYGKSSGNVGFKTCLVAKAASTSLSMAYLLATGRLDSSKKLTLEDVTSGDERFNRKCASLLDGCLVKRSPRTVTISERVIFVREPMERLYSAYRDKIARIRDREWYYEKFTRFMKPNAPAKAEEAIRANFSVTFEEFISWMVDKNQFSADAHWKPQFKNCQPCQYSFIGHVETMAEDLDSLFSRLRVNLTSSDVFAHSDSVNPHRTSKNNLTEAKTKTASLEEILRKLPKNHRDALVSHYKTDYEAFGYDLPDYLL